MQLRRKGEARAIYQGASGNGQELAEAIAALRDHRTQAQRAFEKPVAAVAAPIAGFLTVPQRA